MINSRESGRTRLVRIKSQTLYVKMCLRVILNYIKLIEYYEIYLRKHVNVFLFYELTFLFFVRELNVSSGGEGSELERFASPSETYITIYYAIIVFCNRM